MRVPVLATALILLAGAFAGCFGSDDGGDPQTPASTTDPGNLPGAGDVGGQLVVKAPLSTAITSTSAAWVASGTQIDVAAKAPDRATGNVTYAWAVGPRPGTVAVSGAADTKDIAPGAQAALKFAASGVYRMHCHPHPFMKHNVTVIEGHQSPSTVHVQIVDGAKLGEYRFVPENVVVGMGTTVVYHNNGTQMHTATLESQEPPLKKVDLSAASGKVAVTGNGWQRVLVVATDSEGRLGTAEHYVYVTPELPGPKTYAFDFESQAGVPGSVPADVRANVPCECETRFIVEMAGKFNLTWTAKDAAGANGADPANLAMAEIHLTEQGAAQDVTTGDAAASGVRDGTIAAKPHVLRVVVTQGASVVVHVEIVVTPDLVPPAPTTVSAGGHGGHAGH